MVAEIWMATFALLTFITESKVYLPTPSFSFFRSSQEMADVATIIGARDATYG